MHFTYYGHSCFAIEANGRKMLFDPFIRPNPLASSIDPTSINASLILVSHGHFDHIADAVEIAKINSAKVIANFEICSWLEKQGLSNLQPMNLGGSVVISGLRIKMTSALHSSTLPDGSNGGNPGGFLIETSEGSFYYSGDTALTLDMQLISEEYNLLFAILPIGDVFTMGPTDAARAAELLKTKTIVGVHYDTFPPITLDRSKALSIFSSKNCNLLLPQIGESIEI